MSNYSILEKVSEELRDIVFRALTVPDNIAPGGESGIVLAPPSDDASGNPYLSLFLYQIEQDGHLRNQRPLPVGDAGLRRPPLVVSLRYLITPVSETETTNLLLLGRILQYFHDNPFIGSLGGEPLEDSFGGASPELRVTLESLSAEQLSHIWNPLNSGYRTSLAYRVQLIAIDSALAAHPANRVEELYTVIGTTVRDDG